MYNNNNDKKKNSLFKLKETKFKQFYSMEKIFKRYIGIYAKLIFNALKLLYFNFCIIIAAFLM